MGNAYSSVPAVYLWDLCQPVLYSKYLGNFLDENIDLLSYIRGVSVGIEVVQEMRDGPKDPFWAEVDAIKTMHKADAVYRYF